MVLCIGREFLHRLHSDRHFSGEEPKCLWRRPVEILTPNHACHAPQNEKIPQTLSPVLKLRKIAVAQALSTSIINFAEEVCVCSFAANSPTPFGFLVQVGLIDVSTNLKTAKFPEIQHSDQRQGMNDLHDAKDSGSFEIQDGYPLYPPKLPSYLSIMRVPLQSRLFYASQVLNPPYSTAQDF